MAMTIGNDRIRILGFTPRAIAQTAEFMRHLKDAGFPVSKMTPIIGMALSTAQFDLDGNVIERTGPRLVLGAIEKSELTDEEIFRAGGLEIAIRIQPIPEFLGDYFFDVIDNRFINIAPAA